jgi:hypothetical protein
MLRDDTYGGQIVLWDIRTDPDGGFRASNPKHVLAGAYGKRICNIHGVERPGFRAGRHKSPGPLTLNSSLLNINSMYKIIVLVGLKRFDNEGWYVFIIVVHNYVAPNLSLSFTEGLGLDLDCIWATELLMVKHSDYQPHLPGNSLHQNRVPFQITGRARAVVRAFSSVGRRRRRLILANDIVAAPPPPASARVVLNSSWIDVSTGYWAYTPLIRFCRIVPRH